MAEKWDSPDGMWSKLSQEQKRAIMMAVAAFQSPSVAQAAAKQSPGRKKLVSSRRKSIEEEEEEEEYQEYQEEEEEEDWTQRDPPKLSKKDRAESSSPAKKPRTSSANSATQSPHKSVRSTSAFAADKRPREEDKVKRAAKVHSAAGGSKDTAGTPKNGLRERGTPQWVGATIVKKFGGKPFTGTVTSFTGALKTSCGTDLYHVQYEDDDEEDLTLDELMDCCPKMPK
uniref:PTM/DIR17-like Tudor domain-containing protein n=1 Tax=Hemiselmis andersenii TaxID=464988 RepID=A0A6U5CMA8_HEMAN|mmetsp:Transcript_38291/g.89402  ORF Transcript_38291/g.89402 Transcript_38291/m.89402 type:complete len:228 (+) Transcript_38291:341-1024(+)